MLLRDPLRLFTNAAADYGDMVGMHVGGQRYYLLNHPNHFKHVLQENYRNYPKGSTYKKLKLLLGEGLAVSEGDHWLRQRRLTQPIFQHQRLVPMAEVMTSAAQNLVERWKPLSVSGEPVDIVSEMMHVTQQIIVATMFSTSLGDNADRVCQALDTALHHLSSGLWLSALPDRFVPGHKRFEQALHTLDTIVYRLIEERRRSGEDRDDLLTMLLHARDAETGESMTDLHLRDEVITMFIAGHETTATTLSWTWHMLAQHPEIEQRLHVELATALGGRIPTFQDLPQLTYTRMVIEEVLRHYPPAWALFRSSLAEDIIDGYKIPANSIVILSPYTLHRNPRFWEDPERFDPERFTPERSAKRPNFAYAPFGAGPHLCIGKHFAMMEAQLVLATLAQSYQLRPVPGQPVEASVAVVLRPNPSARLRLHVRSGQV